MNRRDFLKTGAISAALVTTGGIGSVLSGLTEQGMKKIAIQPIRIRKRYDLYYMATIVTADLHLGEIIHDTATIDQHFQYMTMFDSDRMDYNFFKENIFVPEMTKQMDRMLANTYGAFTPIKVRT